MKLSTLLLAAVPFAFVAAAPSNLADERAARGLIARSSFTCSNTAACCTSVSGSSGSGCTTKSGSPHTNNCGSGKTARCCSSVLLGYGSGCSAPPTTTTATTSSSTPTATCVTLPAPTSSPTYASCGTTIDDTALPFKVSITNRTNAAQLGYLVLNGATDRATIDATGANASPIVADHAPSGGYSSWLTDLRVASGGCSVALMLGGTITSAGNYVDMAVDTTAGNTPATPSQPTNYITNVWGPALDGSGNPTGTYVPYWAYTDTGSTIPLTMYWSPVASKFYAGNLTPAEIAASIWDFWVVDFSIEYIPIC